MPDKAYSASAKQAGDLRRIFRGFGVGLLMFASLGTITAVWVNPIFVRMTPVGHWELGATVLTSLLSGVTAALWVPHCSLRASGTGGMASFLGIACPTCNKVLMLVFGGPALLAWFDPLRPYLAAAGVVIMAFAAIRALRAYRLDGVAKGISLNPRSMEQEAPE